MTLPAIAVVGGTGNLGAAIAWRLARAGYSVTIGSRNAESAEKAAAELGHGLRAGANVDVVANALGKVQVAHVCAVQQFQPVDRLVWLLAQGNAGAPAAPASGALAIAIQSCAEKTDGDGWLTHLRLSKKIKC